MSSVDDATPAERATTKAPVVMQLDEAFDRVSALDYEIPNPFVNHGPMACEALTTLGFDSELGEWVEHFETTMHRAIEPVSPTWGQDFPWEGMLGENQLLPEWMGYFERAIDDDGWQSVVRTWVPRLMPGLVSALFHGVIRSSHSVRALDVSDSRARRAELARALGNWAVWFGPGQPTDQDLPAGDPREGTAHAAARAASCYVSVPSIFALHGVTGAMAVHLLSEYLEPEHAVVALAQLEAEHRELYRDVTPATVHDTDGGWDPRVIQKAISSFDPHQVKLVEACVRGLELTGDPGFVAAALLVTSTS